MQRETDQRGILLELPLVLCYSRATGLGIWGVHCLKGQASWEPAPVQPHITPGLPSLLSVGCFLQVTATTLPNPVLLPFYIGTSWYSSLGWVELESIEEWFDLIIRSWVRGLRFILLLQHDLGWISASLWVSVSPLVLREHWLCFSFLHYSWQPCDEADWGSSSALRTTRVLLGQGCLSPMLPFSCLHGVFWLFFWLLSSYTSAPLMIQQGSLPSWPLPSS